MSSRRKILLALSAGGLALAVGATGAFVWAQVGQDAKPELLRGPTGKIVALVQDSEGNRVGHVGVSIQTEDGKPVSNEGYYLPSTTDELGRHEEWLPTGRYLVYAVDDAGTETNRAWVEILEDKETFIQLSFGVPVGELTRENPTPIDD